MGLRTEFYVFTRRPSFYYNLASRAAQSNSVYISVLKIPIVLADGVSKLFFAHAALVSAGKILYFATIMDANKRLGPLVAKQRQFSDLFSWARVKMRQKK